MSTEPPDPVASFARALAIVLAVLIGATLALALRPEGPPSGALPAAEESAAVASPRDGGETPELDALQDVLVSRARDTLTRRGDFRVLLAALGADGGLQVRLQGMGNEPRDVGPMEALEQRIGRGEIQAYGWAQTLHAPGLTDPDGVYFEIVDGQGHTRRLEMRILRGPGRRTEILPPAPVSAGTEPPAVTISPPSKGSP